MKRIIIIVLTVCLLSLSCLFTACKKGGNDAPSSGTVSVRSSGDSKEEFPIIPLD